MPYKSFCKEVLIPAFTVAAFSYECFLILEEFKKAQARRRMAKIDEEFEETLYKMVVSDVYLDLEALEKEIKASQNEKLLRLHRALVKNIEALELKE